jgi:hypothetical protein
MKILLKRRRLRSFCEGEEEEGGCCRGENKMYIEKRDTFLVLSRKVPSFFFYFPG